MFSIPRKLQDLERERGHELSAANVPDIDSQTASDVEAAYHECSCSLADGPLTILNQEVFEAAYIVVRSLNLLDMGHSTKFASTMSHNLHVLVTSGLEELSRDGRDKGDPVVAAHRSAIHAYAFYLHTVHELLHARALDMQKAEAIAKGAASKRRGAKAKDAAGKDDGDRLPAVMERILNTLCCTLKAKLDDILYRSPADKSRLIEVCVLTVARALEDSSIAKQQPAMMAVVLSATQHCNANGCLDLTVEALFRLVKEHDHGGDAAVQAATIAAEKYKSPSLGKALVTKFCEMEPEDYDDIAARDTKPVRRAAEVLKKLAASLPAVVHASISQLMPYFGCETAVTIRSNLVECMGELMRWYRKRGMDEKGGRLLQISRQNAVQTLVARANDKAALVRKVALSTIEKLVEERCWPTEYTVLAASAAVARLDDGSLPAGAALSLLCMLVSKTGTDKLTDSFLVSTLNKLEEQLKGMKPDVVEEGEEGPQWEDGPLGANNRQQEEDSAGGQVPGSASQEGIILPTQLDDNAGGAPPVPRQDHDGGGGAGGNGMSYSQMRLLIASVKELLELSRTLAAALPEVESLLASDSADVTEKAITLLTLCSQKQLQGVTDSWRRVWHLVFSTTEKVRETVMHAFYNFFLPGGSATGKPQPRHMINSLVKMVGDLALCDHEALEELMRLAINGAKPEESAVLGPELVRMMLGDLHAAVGSATLLEKSGGADASEALELAGRISLLCGMVARHAPQLVVQHVEHLVADLKRSHLVLKDALLVRHLALMLRDIAPMLHASAKGRVGGGTKYQPASFIPHALAELLSVLVSGHLPEHGGSWPPAAQAALAAIYRLHPEPHTLLQPLMQHLAATLANGRVPATQVARTIFLVGCIATQQLAMMDSLAKTIRHERASQEKKATQRASADDMDAQLGTGQAREHQLDALQDELEARLMENDSLIGAWGRVVSGLCHAPDLLALHADLASAAMTTLAKFMAIDATYCEDNCPIFFTRLTGGNVKLAPGVRCGMLVALGDLGRRHPNVMEPWTERMFVCLNDENEEVAKTCLRVLAHLILSDMTKPKGHMAHVARCLVAPSAALRDLAIRLFNSLSSKQAKGGANKVYQYLPEIISTVTRGDPMPEQDFKAMMQRLLGYVKVDKLADKLKERLCERFQNVVCEFATSAHEAVPYVGAGVSAAPAGAGLGPGPSGSNSSGRSFEEVVCEWRSLADCIALIPYSEKGLRACMENMRCYKHALGDEHVFQVFKGIAEHGRRANRSPELKQEVAEYEARLLEAHTSLREEQMQQAAAAAAAAAKQAAAAAVAVGSSFGAERRRNQQQGDLSDAVHDNMDATSDAKDPAGERQQPERTPQAAGVNDVADEVLLGRTGDGVDIRDAEVPAEEHGGDADEGDDREARDDANDCSEGPPGEGEEHARNQKEEEDGQEGDAQQQGGPVADVDMDMGWDEGGREVGTPKRSPMGGSDVGRCGEIAAAMPASNVSGTPMAITPVPNWCTRGGQASPQDSMAWSPAPSCGAGTAAASGGRSGPVLQENVQPTFPGFRIKPDPDQPTAGLQGSAWPAAGGWGVRVKPDPEGPGLQGAAWPVIGVVGRRIKPDPDGPWR